MEIIIEQEIDAGCYDYCKPVECAHRIINLVAETSDMNPKDEHLTAEVYIDCKGRKSPKQCGMNTHIVVSDNNHGYIVAQESFIADN